MCGLLLFLYLDECWEYCLGVTWSDFDKNVEKGEREWEREWERNGKENGKEEYFFRVGGSMALCSDFENTSPSNPVSLTLFLFLSFPPYRKWIA